MDECELVMAFYHTLVHTSVSGFCCSTGSCDAVLNIVKLITPECLQESVVTPMQ